MNNRPITFGGVGGSGTRLFAQIMYLLNIYMSGFIRFLTEVGFPIAGALSGGVFIFIILKFILNGVKGGVAGLGGMIGSLQNRVDVMTNEIVKIDTLISHAFNVEPNLDRIAASEGKEDARKD